MSQSPVFTRTWVVVVSRNHARRGLAEGFIMVNHGKRAPLARMSVGDRILVYSPKTTFPDGDPFQAIAIVGTVTGPEPEPSAVIPGGFRLRADLREIEPIPLARIRDHTGFAREHSVVPATPGLRHALRVQVNAQGIGRKSGPSS